MTSYDLKVTFGYTGAIAEKFMSYTENMSNLRIPYIFETTTGRSFGGVLIIVSSDPNIARIGRGLYFATLCSIHLFVLSPQIR